MKQMTNYRKLYSQLLGFGNPQYLILAIFVDYEYDGDNYGI